MLQVPVVLVLVTGRVLEGEPFSDPAQGYATPGARLEPSEPSVADRRKDDGQGRSEPDTERFHGR